MRSSLASLLDLPVVPGILGFEPRLQVIHQDDVVGVLEHAVRGDVPGGIYNAAGDGVLVLSEIAGLLGKPLAPVIPPWGTGLAASVLSRTTGLKLSGMLLNLLRFGRGMDNRRLKATGYRYTYTSREAIIKVAEYQRLRAVLSGPSEGYRYEQAVEEFLRRSPSVRATARAPEEAPANLAAGRAPRPRRRRRRRRAAVGLRRPDRRGGRQAPAVARPRRPRGHRRVRASARAPKDRPPRGRALAGHRNARIAA